MVIKSRVDLEIGIRGFEVAGEGLKVVKLLLEVRAEQEAADLHAEVCHQTGVDRPGVLVGVVVTLTRL